MISVQCIYYECGVKKGVTRLQEKMASFIKKILFGRQLSHGSETENPQTFEQALQPPPPIISDQLSSIESEQVLQPPPLVPLSNQVPVGQ